MKREALPGGGVALEVAGPRRPGLAVMVAAGRRLMVAQSGRPVLVGRVDGGNDGVEIHRRGGYVSPLPPVRAADMRRTAHAPGGTAWFDQWAHSFAGRLAAAAAGGPLHEGPWILRGGRLPVYGWHSDLVTGWPSAYLDWGDGWNGVVPLRPLGTPDGAYRKHVRDGTLAPVLLWWISAFDGYLLLDGHDRAVAALAEGVDPPCLLLSLGVEVSRRDEMLGLVTAHHLELISRLAGRELDAVVRGFGALSASLPYDRGPTRAWMMSRSAWEGALADGAPDGRGEGCGFPSARSR
jgi:hypothetical protein